MNEINDFLNLTLLLVQSRDKKTQNFVYNWSALVKQQWLEPITEATQSASGLTIVSRALFLCQ